MIGMRERAAQIGATLTLRSAPGGGTTITVQLPKTKTPAAKRDAAVTTTEDEA
ncbi:MAG: hypothetical protein QM811_03390 [Pirellulales bacterium]